MGVVDHESVINSCTNFKLTGVNFGFDHAAFLLADQGKHTLNTFCVLSYIAFLGFNG